MNQLKNGTLIVVLATVVIAVFILMTGRDTPDSAKDSEIKVTENEITKNEVKDAAADTETVADSEIVKANDSNSTSSVMPTTAQTTDTNNANAIAAPEGPYAETKDEQQHNAEADKEALTVTNSTSEVEKTEPLIFVEPKIYIATSEQHEVLNHIVQPIWMDQKLGDFKSIETNAIEFKIMPTSADGIQGKNPDGVVTTNSDKFSATSVSAGYNYQQMPMYNGGYYIAPMPSYLMPSMLPAKDSQNQN